MSRVAAALLAIGLLLDAGVASGQKRNLKEENKRRDQALNDRGRYEVMIEAYLAGDTAGSVEVLAEPEWDAERLRLLRRNLDFGGPDLVRPARWWRAAAMLHADVALYLAPDLQSTESQVHVAFASNVIRLGIREAGDEIRGFAERLFVTLAALLRDRNLPMSAAGILEIARERIPDSAPVLYASGKLAELAATDYALAGAVTTHSTSRGDWFYLERTVKTRTGHLNDAVGWLTRAGALLRGDDLLRVHLGRVLALRKDDDEAYRLLDEVLRTTKDDATAYLAAVFIGGLRERQVRLEEAAAAYRAALARFPRGHAAHIGLSEVLQRTGKGDQSRDVLRTLLQMGEDTREPLWWYQLEPPGVSERSLERLRKEVRQ